MVGLRVSWKDDHYHYHYYVQPTDDEEWQKLLHSVTGQTMNPNWQAVDAEEYSSVSIGVVGSETFSLH